MFPSLAQLQLVGVTFSDKSNSKADDLSRLEPMQQWIQYPELCSLLCFLRRTRVKIFTYRGDGEKREMRWTRSDEKEDFDADCWTL